MTQLLAADPVNNCLDWFRRSRAWLNDKHLTLCRIAAPTFLEQERAEWMVDEFRELGWDARLDRVGNAVATLPNRKRDAPAVAVTAHLDTVLAPRTPDDIRVGDEGRFLGPGVSDNGAGLAGLLAIAAAWQEHPPLAESALAPMLVANVGEEGEGNLSGMRFLCREAKAAAQGAAEFPIRSFLILDGPSMEHITCRALASRRFEILVKGPGGHSWNDRGTPNPVHAVSRAVTIFADRASKPVRALAGHAQAGDKQAGYESAYNVGIIQGGTSINAIPAEAWAKVDLRSEADAGIEQLASLLRECLEEAVSAENGESAPVPAPPSGNLTRFPRKPRLVSQVKEIGSRPGGGLADDAPILEAIRAIDQQMGIRSRLDCSSTDANIPLSLGIPAISIGAGGMGGGAHTTAEWFHPHKRELGLQRAMLALLLLLNPPGGASGS